MLDVVASVADLRQEGVAERARPILLVGSLARFRGCTYGGYENGHYQCDRDRRPAPPALSHSMTPSHRFLLGERTPMALYCEFALDDITTHAGVSGAKLLRLRWERRAAPPSFITGSGGH